MKGRKIRESLVRRIVEGRGRGVEKARYVKGAWG